MKTSKRRFIYELGKLPTESTIGLQMMSGSPARTEKRSQLSWQTTATVNISPLCSELLKTAGIYLLTTETAGGFTARLTMAVMMPYSQTSRLLTGGS